MLYFPMPPIVWFTTMQKSNQLSHYIYTILVRGKLEEHLTLLLYVEVLPLDQRITKMACLFFTLRATGAMLLMHIRLILDVLMGGSRMYQIGD